MGNASEMMGVSQAERAKVKSATIEDDMRIGAEESVFNAEEARARVDVLLKEKIPQLQASIEKQKSDLQKSLEAAEKLNARPELVNELKEDAQEIIDDMEIQKMRLEREKEDLEKRLIV